MSSNLLGSVWPEWELLEPLGFGTYSTVFRARLRTDPSRQAAIKIVTWPEGGASPASGKTAFAGDLYRQAEASIREKKQQMARLRGAPNIVTIEDCVLLPGAEGAGFTLYVRMELLKPLSAFLSDRQLKESEVIQIGISLCRALDACHRAGLLHRDVKPENILVNDRLPSGVRYLLGDFGSITGIGRDPEEEDPEGTLNYMAPEAAEHKPPDERSDLYSLGLTLYTLMNRRRLPFLPARQFCSHEEKILALKMRLSGISLPPPPDASPAFRDVILKACAFEPEQRYASAQEMAKALRSAQKKALRTENTGKRKGRYLLIPAVSAGLALALFLLTAPLRGADRPEPAETAVPLLPVADAPREDALADQAETLTRVLIQEKLFPKAHQPIRLPRSLDRLSAATSLPVLLPLPSGEGSAGFFPLDVPGWDVQKTTAGGKVISFFWQEDAGGYLAAEDLPEDDPVQRIEMERTLPGEYSATVTALLDPGDLKLKVCMVEFFSGAAGGSLCFQAFTEDENCPWSLSVSPEWQPGVTVYYDRSGQPVRVRYMKKDRDDPETFENIDGLEWIP